MYFLRKYPFSILLLLFFMLALPAVAQFSHEKYVGYLTAGEQAWAAHQYPAAEEDIALAASEAGKPGSTLMEQLESNAKLSRVYVLMGRLAQAEPSYQKAKAAALEVIKRKGSDDRIVWIEDLALAYQRLGSIESLQKCLEIHHTFSPEHRSVAIAELELATYLLHSRKYKEAEPLADDASKRFDQSKGPGSRTPIDAHITVAQIKMQLHKNDEAEQNCKVAIILLQDPLTIFPNKLAKVSLLLGTIYLGEKKYDKAEESLTQSLKIQEKLAGSLTDVSEQLCLLYLAKNNAAKAEQFGKKALSLRTARLGFETIADIDLMKNVAMACKRNAHASEAAQINARIKVLQAKSEKK